MTARTSFSRTLRLSFALKTAYRTNTVLYALKQTPLVRCALPESLYCSRGLKTFAGVIAALWELVSVFAGKFLYLAALASIVALMSPTLAPAATFLHILLFLSVIGAFANTFLFNPTKEKYYAVILMRMDARAYTVANYAYTAAKTVLGFLPWIVLFGRQCGVPLWLCPALPFGIAGMKALFTAAKLWRYERGGGIYNDAHLSAAHWALIAVLLAAAFGLPALGVAIPARLSAAVFAAGIPAGVLAFAKILTFTEYRAVCKELLADIANGANTPVRLAKEASERRISPDAATPSTRTGFERLNDLFVKRHKRVLWKASWTLTLLCLVLFAGAESVMLLQPDTRPVIRGAVLSCLPYLPLLLYFMNRGASFTQALFMNCDHALLTYAFFKQPANILRLFAIRLREMAKINALPSLAVGVGLALLLYGSGGTADPLNYAALVVTCLAWGLFFSVHYLTMYYLLQPYNAATELKSGTYHVASLATYFACFALVLCSVPPLLFGALSVAFFLLYVALAAVLVYRLAPRTFRIRQ